MPRLLAGIAVMLISMSVTAADIRSITATSEYGIYTLEFDAVIMADFATVRRIVTDYDQLHRLSKSILESRSLDIDDSGNGRRKLVTETCILLFCFDAILVEDVRVTGQQLITTTIIPDLSDFAFGRSYWHLVPESGNTLLRFQSVMEPSFWIPPVIGPWLIKNWMREEVREIILNIERQAGDAGI